MFILYLLAGLAAGVLGGMGMGGGTILIPLLTIFFAEGQLESQGINLVTFLPMAAVAILLHIKNRLVCFKHLAALVPPACGMAAVGALLAKNAGGELVGRMFGGFLIILAGVQAYFALKLGDGDKDADAQAEGQSASAEKSAPPSPAD